MLRPERMGQEPMLKLIISFTLPSIAGLLANSLYNIVDRMFVGRVVGTVGLGAISVCFPFMMISLSLCMLLGVGAVPVISGSLGKEDRQMAERVLGNVASAAVAVSLVITALTYANAEALLRFIGASDELLPESMRYLEIILLGVPFGTLSFVLNFAIRAEGRPNFAMATQIIGAGANIILDALLVWGLRRGVAGAAWGTVISQVISMMWVLSFYIKKKGYLNFSRASLRPNFSVLCEVAALGFPAAVTELSFSLFFVMFNQALDKYSGPVAVSALGAFMGWDSLLFLPVIGIGEGAEAIFGYNWGAQKRDRVLEALKLSLILAAGYFALSAVTVYFFLGDMMRVFSEDEALLKIAVEGGQVAYACVIFSGIAIVTNSFFQGIGFAKLAFCYTIVRQFVLLIPSIIILPRIFGGTGVWACFCAMDSIGGTLGLVLLLIYYKKLGLNQHEGKAVRKLENDA